MPAGPRTGWGLAAAWQMFGEIARQRHSWDEAIHCYRTSAGLWSSLGTVSAVVRPELHIAFVEVERGGAAEVAPHARERSRMRARQHGRWPLVAVIRLAQLAADAAAAADDGWDVHCAGSERTSWSRPSSCRRTWPGRPSRPGRAARRCGWHGRARDVFDLALAQFTRLGRDEDADRVGWGAG